MPYFAPDAPMPMTSCAPRLAEIKASPVTHAGMGRPDKKKTVLVFMYRLKAKPIPSTKTKYTSMIVQSTIVRFILYGFLADTLVTDPTHNTGWRIKKLRITSSTDESAGSRFQSSTYSGR